MMMIILTLNIIFLFMNHPMSMGLIMIFQTLAISMKTGIMIKTFWMSYILLITMLSGMLVLFIYMSSIASNEKFKTSTPLMLTTIMMLTISSLFLLLENKMIIKNNYFKMEMMIPEFKELVLINKIFNSENILMTIILVIYLFITMISSTQIINISEGPMRMKSKYV